MKVKNLKKKKLRHNEYYNTQELFDSLYKNGKEGIRFRNLYELITSENNILLAFRNIKKNKGSKTGGTNGRTIIDIGEKEPDKIISYVRKRLENYEPQKIKRKFIPKPNGKQRPLGIPTIEDRLIQQCILQILEPICESKFYAHSYGFRPNRSTHHAISRCYNFINKNKLHYVIDIDIKGFFDNVNHGKLLKQIWKLGIQDKKVISILSKMLKGEIKGEGIPFKGTPQGGILSPLLSNIVLNELDWWISSQWETLKTRKNYERNRVISGVERLDRSVKYNTLKRTSCLKEMFIVRYADDFRIFCRTYKDAKKTYIAVVQWLKERLGLEINEEKSGITNLRKGSTEFLGIEIGTQKKKDKFVVRSKMSESSKKKCIEKLKDKIKKIKTKRPQEEAIKLNSTILGMQNYYRIASLVSKDFKEIDYPLRKYIELRLKNSLSNKGSTSKLFQERYNGFKGKLYNISGVTIFPTSYVQTIMPKNMNQNITPYTKIGRELIHANLRKVNFGIIQYLLKTKPIGYSIELYDNRISRYIGQKGVCSISGQELIIGNMEIHHIKPKSLGGKDEYKNLIFITKDAHKLIHAKEKVIINKYLSKLNLTDKKLKLLNKFRSLTGNSIIEL
ncbi:group II intron reverse transcriptase/maturase [Priestia sp. TGN 0903]|uniref:group II intron reverse transcriptase/maturase n=1 Tax=Priestia sp. TGN 0903 TaxID=3420730 RepID=UPI003D7711FD